MKTLDSFIKKTPPKKRVSQLKPFTNEILELYKQGYQVEQIQNFLAKNGVKKKPITIYKFLKNNKNQEAKNFSIKTPVTSSSGDKKIERTDEVKETQEEYVPNYKKVPSGKELKALIKNKQG